MFVVEDDGGGESDAVFAIISLQTVDDNAPIFVPVAELNVDLVFMSLFVALCYWQLCATLRKSRLRRERLM